MAVSYVKRLAGPYQGAGQATFSFSFLIFDPEDVYVAKADDSTARSSVLDYGSDYTVSMNADQDSTPGGTITLSQALQGTEVVVIGSAVDYTQTLDLTNYTRFPPERITEELDRIVVQIQQLAEITGRVLTVPPTASMTPEDLIDQLMSAQNDAQEYATQAAQYAQDAADARDEILGAQSTVISAVQAEGQTQIAAVQEAASAAVDAVEAEGDTQAERLQSITEETLVGYGVGGRQETWTLTENVSAGSQVTLPNSMTYIVGRDHFRLSWNGLILFKGSNFVEVGEQDAASAVFSPTFDLKAGDELNAWTVPLGRGELGNVEAEVNTLTESVAELSRRAAFHDVNKTTTKANE